MSNEVIPYKGTDLLALETAPSRYQIELLAQEAKQLAVIGMPGINAGFNHAIVDGNYFRTFWCEPGLIIGKRHKVPHIMKITGECIIWSEDGVIYHPPGKIDFYSFSGDTQKVIWAFERFEATTCHKCESTSLDTVENELSESAPLHSIEELKLLISEGAR